MMMALLTGVCIGLLQPPHLAKTRPSASRRAAAVHMLDDADLYAALRKRTEASEAGSPSLAPLGPDEVGADQMGPQDVVSYCMRSIAAESEDGCPATEEGCKTMLSFAVSYDDKPEDTLGQVQVGYFKSPQGLVDYWAQNPRYETLTRLSEWKPMGPPEMKDNSRKAAQKLLVRREGANWEDMFINMALVDMAGEQGALPRKRWLITSVYKQGTA